MTRRIQSALEERKKGKGDERGDRKLHLLREKESFETFLERDEVGGGSDLILISYY